MIYTEAATGGLDRLSLGSEFLGDLSSYFDSTFSYDLYFNPGTLSFQKTMTTTLRTTLLRFTIALATLLALVGLSGCGGGIPSQKKGEALTETYAKAYFKGDMGKVTKLLPHDERVTGNLTLLEQFMERHRGQVENLGGLKKIEQQETRVLTNTEKGPTRISVSYSLEFRKSPSKGSLSLEARMIDRKWYVTSSNFFPRIPRS